MNITLLGSGSYKSSLTYFRLVAIGQQLAHRGWRVSLIVPSADKYNDFTPQKDASLAPVRLLQPWQFVTRSAMLNLIPYLFTSLIALLRTRPDVVYLYKPTPITIMGLVPRLLHRTPVILDLDDLGSEVMRLQGQSRLQVVLVRWCEQLALRYANAVVVTSSYLQAMVKDKYPSKPVLVMSNGVDPVEYPKAPVRPLRNQVYYFGALNRLSLIEDLLRAVPAIVADVPDAQFLIIGAGSALEEAKQLVQDLGVARCVTFTGWVEMHDLPSYTQYADIAVCSQPDTPTVQAASNLKVFQYMAMASVPVVSRVGDLEQYVAYGKAGMAVEPESVPALSAALVAILLDPKRRRELAAAARNRAETVYAWDVLCNQLVHFMDAEVLGTPATGHKHERRA